MKYDKTIVQKWKSSIVCAIDVFFQKNSFAGLALG
jgi:hypothetical protein